MQSYLEKLFKQFYSYSEIELAYVGKKYNMVVHGFGLPNRLNCECFKNACNELIALFEPTDELDLEYLKYPKVYIDLLVLLDRYTQEQRVEDFEEIAFVLTIIINYPYLMRTETR
jgi:hypothetical protein